MPYRIRLRGLYPSALHGVCQEDREQPCAEPRDLHPRSAVKLGSCQGTRDSCGFPKKRGREQTLLIVAGEGTCSLPFISTTRVVRGALVKPTFDWQL